MSDSDLVFAVDQGTSSTKGVVLNSSGVVVARATVPLGQTHPRSGWVEQDANELLESVATVLSRLGVKAGTGAKAVGLSSQRESAVIWDRRTGEVLGPVLGWQDRRTKDRAIAMTNAGSGPRVREVSGLPLDPMFSALKFRWLLDEVDPDRVRSRRGEIALGTVDSWVLFGLTGEHRIEMGNASRTQLLDISRGTWSDELASLFEVPLECLPSIVNSDDVSQPIAGVQGLGIGTRVSAVLGDSHAALFGHGCRTPGSVKVTYGTGSSIMGLMGSHVAAPTGLVRTIAWSRGTPSYAFEGNILSSGSTLVWLGELLKMSPDELIEAAKSSSGDAVQLVPAFSGLGAPSWDESARAIMTGFDLGTTRNDVARAAVESIPHQVEDVLSAADQGLDHRIETILADGGPSANRWLMQLQADVSQRTVIASSDADLSAIGVAHLAGLSAEVWTEYQIQEFGSAPESIRPIMTVEDAARKRHHWAQALSRSRARPQA